MTQVKAAVILINSDLLVLTNSIKPAPKGRFASSALRFAWDSRRAFSSEWSSAARAAFWWRIEFPFRWSKAISGGGLMRSLSLPDEEDDLDRLENRTCTCDVWVFVLIRVLL